MIATSNDPRDAVLCAIAAGEGVGCFRGSADDKLRRYRDAARAYFFGDLQLSKFGENSKFPIS